jgi:hypothetical protein
MTVAMERQAGATAIRPFKANAEAILGPLTGGNMPCGGAWPDEQVELFRSWIADGAPA